MLYILVMTYHSETKSSGISIIYINCLIKKSLINKLKRLNSDYELYHSDTH